MPQGLKLDAPLLEPNATMHPKVVQYSDSAPGVQHAAQRVLRERLPESQVALVLEFVFACTLCGSYPNLPKLLHTRVHNPWCRQCWDAVNHLEVEMMYDGL